MVVATPSLLACPRMVLMAQSGQNSATLGLVQDEPALRAGAARGILDKTRAAALCRRQVGSEEWSS
jgi:hypothetical protein